MFPLPPFEYPLSRLPDIQRLGSDRMIDAALVKELEFLEGDKSKVYPDSNGYPTIGVGHLLTKSELSSGKIIIGGAPVKYSVGLTELQIQALLDQDLKTAEDAIARLVRVPLTQYQYDALTSWVFNVGGGALSGSTLLKLLNAKQYDQVPVQMKRWTKDHQGQIVPGLVRRRTIEANMWQELDSNGCAH